MKKIVACMPVRDEEWILEKTLGDLSTYVDEIVIVDDGSKDRTPEIIKSFPKVTAIHTNPPGTKPFGNGQESTNRNKTLELARQRKADFILQIDADEIFEERIKSELHNLIDRGCSAKFRVLHFWGDTMNFRVDGEWGGFYRYCLFRLLPRMRFSPQHVIATPKAFDRKNKCKSDVRLLHYGWISPRQRERSLFRYYEVYKLKYPGKHISFEQFKHSTEMQSDLRIVKQDKAKLKTVPWEHYMNERPHRYRL